MWQEFWVRMRMRMRMKMRVYHLNLTLTLTLILSCTLPYSVILGSLNLKTVKLIIENKYWIQNMAISRKTAAATLIALLLKSKRDRSQKKWLWVREWIRRRETEKITQQLIEDLRDESTNLFKDFFRISLEQFEYLLEKVHPLIVKKDTNMRKAITSETRLLITLRYLSSGDSYRSLMLLFRVPHNTISGIVPQTCKAIFESLRTDFLKVYIYNLWFSFQ